MVDIVNTLIPDLSGDITQIETDILSLQVSQTAQDVLIDNNTNEINLIKIEQITQNNRLTDLENEQITQNNRLDVLESHDYPESLENLADVTITQPVSIGQVFAYGGNGWGNYTIDISTEQPIIDLNTRVENIDLEQITQNRWLETLEAQTYPESLRNLADVTISPTVGDNGKIILYNETTDKFVLDVPPNPFPEAPNTNLAYIWKTTANVGSWQLLSTQTEITGLQS